MTEVLDSVPLEDRRTDRQGEHEGRTTDTQRLNRKARGQAVLINGEVPQEALQEALQEPHLEELKGVGHAETQSACGEGGMRHAGQNTDQTIDSVAQMLRLCILPQNKIECLLKERLRGRRSAGKTMIRHDRKTAASGRTGLHCGSEGRTGIKKHLR